MFVTAFQVPTRKLSDSFIVFHHSSSQVRAADSRMNPFGHGDMTKFRRHTQSPKRAKAAWQVEKLHTISNHGKHGPGNGRTSADKRLPSSLPWTPNQMPRSEFKKEGNRATRWLNKEMLRNWILQNRCCSRSSIGSIALRTICNTFPSWIGCEGPNLHQHRGTKLLAYKATDDKAVPQVSTATDDVCKFPGTKDEVENKKTSYASQQPAGQLWWPILWFFP